MAKEIPFVTVGIPTFNEQRFIKKAILSVLNQTYENFELIITDDASTDSTVEIIKSINDNRIRLIEGKDNKGIAYRLNQQIELAQGKYFFRMDADDLMFPDRLEKQVTFLEKNSNVDAIGAQVIIINDEDKIIGMRQINQVYFSIDQLFASTRFLHPTVAAKTEWFKQWKYQAQYAGCEDFDLWIRSYNKSTFADIPEPLLFYRDPLKFKLRTYLSRKYKGSLCCISLHKYAKSKTLILRILFKNFIASLVAVFFYVIKKDSIIIERRNNRVKNLELYNKILTFITKNN